MAFPPQGTAGNDVYYINGSFTTLHDGYAYLDGSDGFDAIVLTGGGNYQDYIWGGVSNFEDLILSSGDWNLTLGSSAAAAFTNKHVVVDAWNAGSITIEGAGLAADASLQVLDSYGNDSIHGGAGTNAFLSRGGADTFIGGAGNDYFYFANDTQFRNAHVEGGGGRDTVILQAQSHLNDVDWLNFGHITAVRLTGSGAQAITLGATASAAFNAEVAVSSSNALYLDATNLTTKLHAYASGGDDTFVIGSHNDVAIYNFTAHGQANADQVQLVGHGLAEVQAMLAGAVQATEGTYLYHDGHVLLFAGVARAALSTADFLFA